MRLAKRLKSPPLIRPLALAKRLSPAPPEAGLPAAPKSPKTALPLNGGEFAAPEELDKKLDKKADKKADKKLAERKEKDGKPDRKQVEREACRAGLAQLHKMSNEELEYLLEAEDHFALDCLLEGAPSLTGLLRERDHLQKQNTDLAKFNYAREPEFVKDRLRLRQLLEQTSQLRRRLMAKQLAPILERLDECRARLAASTSRLEEQCEQLAADFLQGRNTFNTFRPLYLELRASASRHRILADRLAAEHARLLAGLPKVPVGGGGGAGSASSSPVAAPRHRKRVSFNR